MQRPYLQGKEEGKAEGKAEGRVEEARDLLRRFLKRRGFEIAADVERRISTEVDVARLERWIEAAVGASSMADVFAEA